SCFFSSRRRHTRFSRDWSSDVCSSDLATRVVVALGVIGAAVGTGRSVAVVPGVLAVFAVECGRAVAGVVRARLVHLPVGSAAEKIGRASGRGRAWISGVAVLVATHNMG